MLSPRGSCVQKSPYFHKGSCVPKGPCVRRLQMPNSDRTDLTEANCFGGTEASDHHPLFGMRMQCCDELVRDKKHQTVSSPSKNLFSELFLEENRLRPISVTYLPASNALCSRSASSSPNGLASYAGAKFNESPSPKVLPRPPSHWVGTPKHMDCGTIESELKVMLRVQCWNLEQHSFFSFPNSKF